MSAGARQFAEPVLNVCLRALQIGCGPGARGGDPRLVERFESYVDEGELTNPFSEELTDQLARFAACRRAAASASTPGDVLTDGPSIRDVIAVPTMRPKG